MSDLIYISILLYYNYTIIQHNRQVIYVNLLIARDAHIKLEKYFSVVRVVTHTKENISKFERYDKRKNTTYYNTNIVAEKTPMNIYFKRYDTTLNPKFDEMVKNGQFNFSLNLKVIVDFPTPESPVIPIIFKLTTSFLFYCAIIKSSKKLFYQSQLSQLCYISLNSIIFSLL